MAAASADNADPRKGVHFASLVEYARHNVYVATVTLQYRDAERPPTGIPLYGFGLCTAESKDVALAVQKELAPYVKQEIPRIWSHKLWISDTSRRKDGSRFTLYMTISKCTEEERERELQNPKYRDKWDLC